MRRSSLTTSLKDRLIDPQRRHPVGFEPQHERQVLRRKRLPENRRIFVRRGIALATNAGDP
jgi:hypothetical protein